LFQRHRLTILLNVNQLVPIAPVQGTPLSQSQVALIQAAERLFAERVIESVSLREIAQAAGNGNNNAVRYHFGSKNELIDSIFRYRVEQMDPKRRAMLQVMERDGALGDLRRLAEAYCLPLLDLTDAEGRHTYAGFVQQYVLRYRPQGLPHATDTATESTAALRRIQDLVEQRLAHLPPDCIEQRITLAYQIFANMLVISDSGGIPQRDPEQFRQRIENALSMIVAAYAAP
jgi:TetR/AcrR family transcriptional regulator, regulator of cefoperazone and chloramphenicol sensitivity